MGKGKMNIALIQHQCGESHEQNIQTAEKMITEAAQQGAKIICTQELFAGQYFPQTIDVNKYEWAEPIPGPICNRMQSLSEELGVVIIVSLYEYVRDGLYFNTVVVYEEGEYLGKYRKHHIPEGPQYIEKYYFTEGDTGYPVFKTKYGTIGVLICWDEWFPEPSRILALKGADVVFYPSAIGSEPDNPGLDTSQTWMDAIRAHGIHNNMFIAAVNRVGREDSNEGHMTFYGRSFISNPWGTVIKEAETKENEIIMAEIDLSEVTHARNVLQFHRDRRPDSYGELLKRVIEE
ncbi:carbon-nitrogen hydrolase [Bacillus badius]|uniref:N-carbamoylputrescine amidase n=2 Tax=Bacillus badius TaxID=1455 RepID=A0ABR5AVK8_BACBA|nr:N-carbamoylputrescine amidase [Bacillus badius]KIL78773.1 N-carbamoylputrescine amidase [Bacillus badius]KZR57670.1 N-carbamoylputrescine amidase [Bacillus badius]